MKRFAICALIAALAAAACCVLLRVCGGAESWRDAETLLWKAKYTLRKAANTVGLGA